MKAKIRANIQSVYNMYVSIAAESHMHYAGVDTAGERKADVSIWPLSSLFFSLYSYLKLGPDCFHIIRYYNNQCQQAIRLSQQHKTSIGSFVNSSADKRPHRSDLKDKSDFPAVGTGCVLANGGLMCTRCLLLLPPCKRVGDADDACKTEFLHSSSCKLGR